MIGLAEKLWNRIEAGQFPELAEEMNKLKYIPIEELLEMKGEEEPENETRRFDGTAFRKIGGPGIQG